MRLVLIGGGGHASDVLSVLEALEFDGLVGMVADEKIDLKQFSGRRVEDWGSIDGLGSIGATHYILAIGYSKPRRQVAERVMGLGLTPMTIIHPTANVPKQVSVGAGSTILAGAIVSTRAVVGAHVCLHHNSVIGHDCTVGDFCTVLPGANVSGGVDLQEASLIGTGATVIERCIVGKEAVVGAGAVVTKDIPAGVTAMGAPARW